MKQSSNHSQPEHTIFHVISHSAQEKEKPREKDHFSVLLLFIIPFVNNGALVSMPRASEIFASAVLREESFSGIGDLSFSRASAIPPNASIGAELFRPRATRII